MHFFDFLVVKRIISRAGELHFCRWRLLQTPWFGLYIHQICRSDEEKDPHDHPWWFASFVISGGYVEKIWDETGVREARRPPGAFLSHRTTDFHKITLLDGPAWTLVVTGRRTHDRWGYLTDSGWVDSVSYRREKNANAL